MHENGQFQAAYQDIERRMQALAEADGDVFLPNPEPKGPVQYVLICMEPSLGRWADSAGDARSKVEEGFRNFTYSIEDFILHFCAKRYLRGSYHITDLSKGAMLVEHARRGRSDRYDRWYSLLEEELDLVAAPGVGIITIGRRVSDFLVRKPFERPFMPVIHYSGQAARARNEGIAGREDAFRAFKDSVSLEDVIATATDVLKSTAVPDTIRDETLSRLERRELTTSRKQLIFIYKEAFESMSAEV